MTNTITGKALFVPVNVAEKPHFVDIPLDDSPSDRQLLDKLHSLLDCSTIETVYVFKDLVAVVDESGYANGKQPNFRASPFYRGFTEGYPLMGDVLFLGVRQVPYVEDGKTLFYEEDLGGLPKIYQEILSEAFQIEGDSDAV